MRKYLGLFFFVFWVAIRLFLVDFYSIPSDSMTNTILPGDIIIVYKQIFSKVKRSQVVVFVAPNNMHETIIKRCVALPGDTLEIKDAVLYINGTTKDFPPLSKHCVRIDYNNRIKTEHLLDSLKIPVNFFGLHVNALITKKQEELLLSKNYITSAVVEYEGADIEFAIDSKIPQAIFPHNKSFPWSLDNFGPIVIPYKGMRITSTNENQILYGYILKTYEGQDFMLSDSIIGEDNEFYTFSKDYYFFLGDNRHNSRDSRYYGFVPHENLIGNARIVLLSKDIGNFWNRFFTLIR